MKTGLQVILFGWSMGAAIALKLADEPEFLDVVAGLILESPILDWVSTLKANCARAGLPEWITLLALPWLCSRTLSRATGLQNPINLRRFAWLARANELTAVILIVHGRGDTSSPVELAARLSFLRVGLVNLEVFDADHTMTWYSDRERWREAIFSWVKAVESIG
ncbi:alpha/beta hydrolase family protein [Salinibacterium hongtaonis]|uniref:alpha/beta hydrolase family protein n=1 Tax=Homoserinimonas hongtaonis TaxID=2079791 RepID=UPI000D3B5893|nr:alpha/beta fold hydrolase [Salinibacterium hongtaonis]AWB89447.1 hypothetical protein C2138_07755 [Salinibacterium hongtaonis]